MRNVLALMRLSLSLCLCVSVQWVSISVYITFDVGWMTVYIGTQDACLLYCWCVTTDALFSLFVYIIVCLGGG